MESAEIRRRWLSYFAERGHTVVPSAPLLYDDPTLLFVNAGMVPFKPYFLGQETAPYARATSVQKCVRTLDIDEVGKTTRHGTFFQMNGNFSFGDYFKAGAIELAWELVTRAQSDGGYGFPESALLVTVYKDDDEAIDLWRRVAGLPDERIVRLGMRDNFWSMGVPGPCGPCSEILIDRGPDYGPEGDVENAGDRYLEFWNLVFMQHVRGEGAGKEGYPILGDLPAKNIDTGMGLERVAFLLQGTDNMYEIDEIFPVISRVQELSGRRYGAVHDDDVRMRVVADHVRSGLMLIGDGVVPSNEARGYVLRRLLRRAVRAVRLLGVEDAVLLDLVTVSKDRMKVSYPELEAGFERISQIVAAEEEAFSRTLASGTTILDVAVREAKAAGQSTLGGERAFALHDTYGFPIDLTLEMAAEQGLDVDEPEFRRLMGEQRDRAKADARTKKTGHGDTSVYRTIADSLGRAVDFTGYDGGGRRGHGGGPGGGRRGRPGRARGRRRRGGPRPDARSTPRAGASWPTPVASSSRVPCSWSTTSSRPSQGWSCTGPGCCPARWRWVLPHRAWSTSTGASRSAVPIPPRTWCTRRSARRWARPRRRRGRRTRRGASASTSTRPPPCPRACCATSRRG